jgi:hypothetical protein
MHYFSKFNEGEIQSLGDAPMDSEASAPVIETFDVTQVSQALRDALVQLPLRVWSLLT